MHRQPYFDAFRHPICPQHSVTVTSGKSLWLWECPECLECVRVSQSVPEYPRVSQSISECFRLAIRVIIHITSSNCPRHFHKLKVKYLQLFAELRARIEIFYK